MKDINLILHSFRRYFIGDDKNYGRHIYNYTPKGKEEGQNYTVKNKLITDDNFIKHLTGQEGLGLIPIKDNNHCSFSVIDIDIYEKKLDMYIEAIEKHNLPLIVFRTKSGGLHLYCFYKQEVPAKKAIELMRHYIMLLGLDILVKLETNRLIEVFPKQQTRQKNQIGNWINLPYYNYEKTKQYCIHNGEELSINKCLQLINTKIDSYENYIEQLNSIPYQDAPPCLSTLYMLNDLEKNSGRNNYLFSFGVYFKKKDENFFQQNIIEVNSSMREPLDDGEVQRTIIHSLENKDYAYKCSEQPCVKYCNKNECKKREFGVGKEGGYFSTIEYGQMYQYKTIEPYYEWEIRKQGDMAFKTIRFRNEDEIIKQDTFLKMCLRELLFLPAKLKQSVWFRIVNQHVVNAKKYAVDEQDDTGPYAIFNNYLNDFVLNRSMAKTKDQIFAKRVYYNERSATYYFRVKDLITYMSSKQFRHFSYAEVHWLLKQKKVVNKTIKTESRKSVRVCEIAKEQLTDTQIDYSSIDFESDLKLDKESNF